MIKKVFLFLMVSFLFTGCFEILEEVSLKEDGSGTFKLTMNLSQSKTKLKSVMLMEKVNGHKVPSKAEVKAEVEKACNIARNTPGISGVSSKVDFENYIFTIKCNFKNIQSLNRMTQKIRASKEKKTTPFEKHYEYNNTTKEFKRNFKFLWGEDFSKLNQKDKDVFKQANYISVYRFEKEVVTTSNKKAKVSPNKKNILLRISALDIINHKSTIKNQIKLK